jgi:hypothetical protein
MKAFSLAASVLTVRARLCAAADVTQEAKISQGAADFPNGHLLNQSLCQPFLDVCFAATVTKGVVKEVCPFSGKITPHASAHCQASIAELFDGGFPQRIYV